MVQRSETLAQVDVSAAPRRQSLWLQVLVRLVKEKPLGLIGGVIVLVMIVLAVFADIIAPFPYDEMHLRDRLRPSSLTYLFGTDNMGRDIFSRVVYGARISMMVGLGTVSLGTGIATVIGVLSAYFGGRIDTYTQRLVDAWQAFPWLIILLTIMAIIGPGIGNVILALGILTAASGSRVIRSAVLTAREQQYIEAARAVGCGHVRIILRYILPNIVAPIIILATIGLGAAILIEAALSFLGFGVPPPHPSWGEMLSGSGRNYMYKAPWMAIWPGVAISLAVFGFNMLGDALRDLLDPRLRGDATRST
jgi:peptide/nickel transport system permease protein